MSQAAPALRAVLFDLDDTLFDHLGTARAALAATQAQEPALRQASLDALCRHYGELLEEMHPRLLAGELTVAQARQRRFEGLLAPYGLGPAAGAVAAGHYAHYRRLRRLLPGAAALVRALAGAGYRLGVVTNNRLAEQQDKLRHLGLAELLLPGLVTSEEVGAAKPDPRVFDAALARLAVAPAEAVLVGDSWVADVEGALAVGIRPVWLNRLGRAAPRPGVAELAGLEPLAAAYATITGRALPAGP